MIRYQFIDQLGIGITDLNLEALEFNTNQYSTLLYQHRGNFQPTPQKFGNSNDAASVEQFSNFIRLAKQENGSIAMTPEYSCPWPVIETILQTAELQPKNGKLYALGCESISPAEIQRIRDTHSGPNCIIYFDNTVLDVNGNFFDPLCYIFKNENRLYLIIQFKTHHMGVWTTRIESDNYKNGRTVYILRNDVNSVYLFSLICSEAMNFRINEQFNADHDNRWNGNAYIILNPQLNPNPNSREFQIFYESVLTDYTQKDLICLNWANGTTANGNAFIQFSRSGIFIKSHQIDFDRDTRFISNHQKGLYYLSNKKEIHSFYLTSNKSVFKVRCQKPMTSGVVGVQLKKTEPIIEKVFHLNGNNFIEDPTVDDNFTNFLDAQACPSNFLRRHDISCPDKERLAVLSSGYIDKSDAMKWQFLNRLYSYQLDSTWNIKRLTFLEDNGGNMSRMEFIEAITILNGRIVKDESLWPPILHSFRGHAIDEIRFLDGNTPMRLLHNFISEAGRATVAYLPFSRRESAQYVLDSIKNIFQDHARNRVVVWFKTSNLADNYDSVTSEDLPAASDVPVYEIDSINR